MTFARRDSDISYEGMKQKIKYIDVKECVRTLITETEIASETLVFSLTTTRLIHRKDMSEYISRQTEH
jgi:hypothetical protein